MKYKFTHYLSLIFYILISIPFIILISYSVINFSNDYYTKIIITFAVIAQFIITISLVLICKKDIKIKKR